MSRYISSVRRYSVCLKNISRHDKIEKIHKKFSAKNKQLLDSLFEVVSHTGISSANDFVVKLSVSFRGNAYTTGASAFAFKIFLFAFLAFFLIF